MKHDHLKELATALAAKTCEPPPSPWKATLGLAVGGLEAVGFAKSSDQLLVVSSAGCSVVDCIEGLMLYRDRENDAEYDPIALSAVHPLSHEKIAMAGLHGGGLPNSTVDGWSIEPVTLDFPEQKLFLSNDRYSIFSFPRFGDLSARLIAEDLAFRAFGFSPTGRSLITATSSDLDIYAK